MDYATFIAVHDEFASVPAAKVNYYLAEATSEIDPETYQERTEKAIRLLTAHYLFINTPVSSTPAAIAALGFKVSDIKSIEIQDDIAVTFNSSASQGSAIPSTSSSGLDASIYGQQLEALKRSLIVPFTFT